MWGEAFAGLVVEVGQILAAAAILRLAVGIGFDYQFFAFAFELTVLMGPQIEIAPVSHAFQFAVFTGIQKRKRVLYVRRADRIVRELFLRVIAENQIVAGNAQFGVPVVPPIPPVFVPLARLVGMTEELHFHLLKLSRAKRKVAGRDFVSKNSCRSARCRTEFSPGCYPATFLKFTNMPCAVSGRKNAVPSSSVEKRPPRPF